VTSLLAGRGAVVVGGSRGIGAAVSALLAQHGAGVVVNGRDADAVQEGALDVAAPDYAAPIYAYLASDLAAGLTGEIFVAAGGFVGRFPRPTPTLIGYRDHHDSPPWSAEELARLVAKHQADL